MHLVELCETGEYFAMKAMDKGMMLNRNKVTKLDHQLYFSLSLSLSLISSDATCWSFMAAPLFSIPIHDSLYASGAQSLRRKRNP